MKTIKIKNILLITLTLLFAYSCSVDDMEQTGKLGENDFIVDENTANAVINELYSSTRAVKSLMMIQRLTVSGVETKSVKTGYKEFYENNVSPNDRTLQQYYQNCFYTVNLANRFIKKMNTINTIIPAKKNEMLAVVRTHRAFANFTLLRVFGQFYDTSSKYGIVLTEEPITSTTVQKRGSVSDTYNLIIKDLSYALKNIKDKQEDEYVSSLFTKTFVEALLAKVYLNKGDFGKATKHASNVINNQTDNFELETTYSDIFKNQWKSREVLYLPFQSPSDINQSTGSLNFFSEEFVKPSDELVAIANNQVPDEEGNAKYSSGYDPRFSFAFKKPNQSPSNHKYPKLESNSCYHLRLAEVYLIYAEALVRSNGDQNLAIEALNTIRIRAGVNPKEYITFDKKSFLEDVRIEKLLELTIENAEPWFDLIRYDRLGNLSAKDVKASISNQDKLIFPLPLQTLKNNKGSVFQNPGY